MTLRRITRAIIGLTTTRLPHGSVVYRGTVPAGLIARESGFKEGHAIRVSPFGYVAHDEAADPAAPLDTQVTVTDGVIREIAVTWGTSASAHAGPKVSETKAQKTSKPADLSVLRLRRRKHVSGRGPCQIRARRLLPSGVDLPRPGPRIQARASRGRLRARRA
jgi:hypothetical protein